MARRVMTMFAVFAGCLAGAATPGLAATQVSVDCGAGANLQAAINAAKAGTILAISGTCPGTFVVAKKLVLKGVSDAVLDGQGAGTTLTVSAGTVSVKNLIVTGGLNEDGAGGIQNSGSLTLVRVTVQRNEGDGGGGGVRNQGTLLIQRSIITRNDGPDEGGGVWNSGTATIEKSTISGNAGGVSNGASATLTLTNSTVSGNRESSVYGAGVLNDGTAVIMHSTIANNASTNAGGGGIGNSGTLTVVESTISGNLADEMGGGIVNDGTVTLTATILAGNVADNGDEPQDCAGLASGFISNGYNLFGTACAAAQPTDQGGTFDQPLDPMLKVLGSFAGPTQTMVPRPGSPAVNAIPVGAPGGLCPPSGTTDQRGIPRPQAGACDIGSVERKPKE
jgi:nitrous oxidase accessory protein NosD